MQLLGRSTPTLREPSSPLGPLGHSSSSCQHMFRHLPTQLILHMPRMVIGGYEKGCKSTRPKQEDPLPSSLVCSHEPSGSKIHLVHGEDYVAQARFRLNVAQSLLKASSVCTVELLPKFVSKDPKATDSRNEPTRVKCMFQVHVRRLALILGSWRVGASQSGIVTLISSLRRCP